MKRLTCREIVDFLEARLDGRLTPDELSAFEWHLERCSMCRSYLASYEAARSLGRSVLLDTSEPAADAPEGLVRAILAAREKCNRMARPGIQAANTDSSTTAR